MAINYNPVGWDPTKYFGPTNMNHMDDGIKAACDGVDKLTTEVAAVNESLENLSTLNNNGSSLEFIGANTQCVLEASSPDYTVNKARIYFDLTSGDLIYARHNGTDWDIADLIALKGDLSKYALNSDLSKKIQYVDLEGTTTESGTFTVSSDKIPANENIISAYPLDSIGFAHRWHSIYFVITDWNFQPLKSTAVRIRVYYYN